METYHVLRCKRRWVCVVWSFVFVSECQKRVNGMCGSWIVANANNTFYGDDPLYTSMHTPHTHTHRHTHEFIRSFQITAVTQLPWPLMWNFTSLSPSSIPSVCERNNFSFVSFSLSLSLRLHIRRLFLCVRCSAFVFYLIAFVHTHTHWPNRLSAVHDASKWMDERMLDVWMSFIYVIRKPNVNQVVERCAVPVIEVNGWTAWFSLSQQTHGSSIHRARCALNFVHKLHIAHNIKINFSLSLSLPFSVWLFFGLCVIDHHLQCRMQRIGEASQFGQLKSTSVAARTGERAKTTRTWR